MPSSTQKKDLALAAIYFALSTVLTWWFVAVSPLYISQEQMLLSTAVAGGKWGVQIILGMLFLKEKSWRFVKNIGFVCFVGSCILVPYVIFSKLGIADGASFFVGSLAASVAVMIYLYYLAVKKSDIPLKWWFFWLICLATAISLQLTVVFHVF